ncbi:MerR family transcriptional regulator [Rhodocyclus purpureus]|uniref:MerR family transcriptional regulator n=1 Tax=Rhodocyclus purpureus TaxID=1067 RepID=UPI001914CC70|nr:MerR family transcriptional regulator [Rhodocyclus purpureus]MBK5912999.1 MerR family transcriptional regulator [Rhodocyclus purpureus]
MNTPRPPLNIGSVERDTGLGKDTLRAWERRYGFPTPDRDEHGERLYPAEQVDRLRLIKRLIDLGYRPGKLVGAGEEELALLGAQSMPVAATTDGEEIAPQKAAPLIERVLGELREHDLPALQQTLSQALLREGLQRFVIDTVGPLNIAVGEAWMRGEIEVFEEHLYTEQITTLLRQALAGLAPSGQPPRVLLTTVPDELHTLGLLMVQALLALEGASCIPLGTQLPLFDLRQAAIAHRADIVALSFSAAFPTRQLQPLVGKLRELLPPEVELWIGGGGCTRLRPLAGLRILPTLEGALSALEEWRQRR